MLAGTAAFQGVASCARLGASLVWEEPRCSACCGRHRVLRPVQSPPPLPGRSPPQHASPSPNQARYRRHCPACALQDWGGICDRHFVASSKLIVRALNITQQLLSDPDAWIPLLHFYLDFNRNINSEFVLKTMWQHAGVPIRRFPKAAFAVRATHDTTGWSEGKTVQELPFPHLRIKYIEEFNATVARCPDWLPHLQTLKADVLRKWTKSGPTGISTGTNHAQ